MILYYLNAWITEKKELKNFIDPNVRSDYSKLRYLVYTDNKLNGNFNALNKLIEGKALEISSIKDNFSAFEMSQPENFLSLLFALGFVSIVKNDFTTSLKIPNQTIQNIIGDFIYTAFKNIKFDLRILDFQRKVIEFLKTKSLAMFHYLADELKNHTVVRDYIDGEAIVKGFLMCYLTFSDFFEVLTEQEVNKGFVDIILNPIREEIPHGALIELKYIKRTKFSDALLQEKMDEAKKQLLKYDVSQSTLMQGKEFMKIILVFNGWEMVYCEMI